ncbi:MAG: type II toxin-antitoxin system HicB family antitoxin [Candidatus Omnitrophica bacterium]|nr:type II toxin-antitoxin system HicB family antitoxin [Candidatus Omnitrophota bacterium]
MKYPVSIHKSEYGYDAHCPLLPGCHSQGDTLKETLINIKDAIRTYLEMINDVEKALFTKLRLKCNAFYGFIIKNF